MTQCPWLSQSGGGVFTLLWQTVGPQVVEADGKTQLRADVPSQ
jgi:hypothetical protein